MGRREVTGAEVKQWREWKEQGHTLKEITLMSGRSRSVVEHHLYPNQANRRRELAKEKYSTLTPEQKQELWDSRREYQRSYHRGYKRNG